MTRTGSAHASPALVAIGTLLFGATLLVGSAAAADSGGVHHPSASASPHVQVAPHAPVASPSSVLVLAVPIARPDVVTFLGAGPFSVRVLLNDSAGDVAVPLVPSSVTLQLPAGPAAGSVLSPSGKSLVLAGEGTYLVQADGSVAFTPEPGFQGRSGPVPYTVLDANGTAASSVMTLTVEPKVTMTGSVIEHGTGAPISGADVTISDRSGHRYATTTDANGVYLFVGTAARPISTGPVTVAASKVGYVTASSVVVADADVPNVVGLELVPAPALAKTGTDVSGLLAAAVALILVGAGLMARSRRDPMHGARCP